MTTTTHERLRAWVNYWSSPGEVDDKGPRRPRDVSVYHDEQLKQIGRKLATIERERERERDDS